MATLISTGRTARSGARLAVPLVVLGLSGWALSHRLTTDMLVALPAQLAQVTAGAWIGAACFTLVSLWSVGRYDLVAHRYFRTGIPDRAATLTGTLAIALAQTLGFGLVTGALARWRCLPGLGPALAFQLSAFVAGSFIAGWAVLTAIACLLLPAPDWTAGPAALGLLVALVGLVALVRWPRPVLAGRALRLPSLQLAGAILLWSAVDTMTAAAALWLLLPEAAGISYAVLLPLYLLALGSALVSSTPGGVGPFELVLLTALPAVPTGDLLASIVAFRLVYYALPATLAACAMLRPLSAPRPDRLRPDRLDTVLATAPRSEVAVIRQNGGFVLPTATGCAAVWPTGQTLTGLADPIRGDIGAALVALRQQARVRGLIPLVYKCNARNAVTARRRRWSVVHLADEALIDLRHFEVNTPTRRTLRRKLRAADKAGVELGFPPAWPWAALAEIDAAWQARNGTAHGGTMGRFSPDYVAGQWVAIAWHRNRAVAFVTCHAGRSEWCLDLMRQVPDAPDGTMHRLVMAAITAARETGAHTVNLAATPACPDPASTAWRWIAQRIVARSGGTGLRQFKSNFAPRWVPRYAAAPGPVALAVGLADIAREVHRPPPLNLTNSNPPHDLDENYELASSRAS